MMRNRSRVTTLVLVALLGSSSLAIGVNMGKDRESSEEPAADAAEKLYRKGSDLAASGKFHDALEKFERANASRADDPEILNMLAYCQRKTGDLDAAFANYARALELRPEFPQAREYLGEAHLQAALQQLDILRGYGHRGRDEYAMLADALRAAAGGLTDAMPAGDRKEDGRRW